jgi:hypothetical protein
VPSYSSILNGICDTCWGQGICEESHLLVFFSVLSVHPRATPVSFAAANKVGLFNACSIADKHTTISTWITDNNLSLAAVVETWHNSADDPNLIACAPPTHHYIERARPRPASKANKLASNHGGVCLFYRKSLAARTIPLQSFTTFEVRAVYLQGALLTALVVTLYRPGSAAVTHEFFDEFSSLLEQIVILILGAAYHSR